MKIIVEYEINDGKQNVCIILPADMPKDVKSKIKVKLSDLLNGNRFSLFAKKFHDSPDGSCRIDCGDKYDYHVYEGIIGELLKDQEYDLSFNNNGIVGFDVAINDEADGSIIKITFPKETVFSNVIDAEAELLDHKELKNYNPRLITNANKQDMTIVIKTDSKIPDAHKKEAATRILAYVKGFYKPQPKQRPRLGRRWF